VAESRIRRQLTTLAEQKKIKLTGWDGRGPRPYTEWANAEDFVIHTQMAGIFTLSLWIDAFRLRLW